MQMPYLSAGEKTIKLKLIKLSWVSQLEKFLRASLRVLFFFLFLIPYDWFICWQALLNRQAIGRAKYLSNRRKLLAITRAYRITGRGFAACLSCWRICDYIYLSITWAVCFLVRNLMLLPAACSQQSAAITRTFLSSLRPRPSARPCQ